jgi:L-ascorbate metabolism protein UlaG (beta-lactamase superfamily)
MLDIRLMKGAVAAVIVATATLGAQAPVQKSSAKPMAKSVRSPISVQWLGHAAFEIVSSGGTRILIDPWLSGNPSTPDSLKPISRYTGATKPAAILVTHSHSDHSADAKAIALASGAPVIGTFEWVNTLGLPEAQSLGGNVGGTMKVGDVTVHLVPAMHSSDPGGRPLGFVLEFADGRTLYHTGDTWLFGDMALIQERYHPSILLLAVGGGPYTQDAATAAFEVKKYFTPAVMVPMHYATFPALNSVAQVEAAFKGDGRLKVLTPGEARKF